MLTASAEFSNPLYDTAFTPAEPGYASVDPSTSPYSTLPGQAATTFNPTYMEPDVVDHGTMIINSGYEQPRISTLGDSRDGGYFDVSPDQDA